MQRCQLLYLQACNLQLWPALSLLCCCLDAASLNLPDPTAYSSCLDQGLIADRCALHCHSSLLLASCRGRPFP